MNKIIIAAVAFGLSVAGHAQAGEPACSTGPLKTLSLACHLRAVETIGIRLDGSAATLGLRHKRLKSDVHKRLKIALPATVRVAPAIGATKPAAPLTLSQRGHFSCVVWTVGANFPIALFVECSLESLDGEQTIEARLLGHTRQTELDDSVQLALRTVINKVSKTLHDQRKSLRGPATRYNVGNFN